MPRKAKEPTPLDSQPRTINYCLERVPIKLWSQFKLLCFQEEISLKEGLLRAIGQYIRTHAGELETAIETVSDGGGESDIQPGE